MQLQQNSGIATHFFHLLSYWIIKYTKFHRRICAASTTKYVFNNKKFSSVEFFKTDH